jgi:hypothetical protein
MYIATFAMMAEFLWGTASVPFRCGVELPETKALAHTLPNRNGTEAVPYKDSSITTSLTMH